MPVKTMTKLIDALSVRTRLGEVMEQAEKENIRFFSQPVAENPKW